MENCPLMDILDLIFYLYLSVGSPILFILHYIIRHKSIPAQLEDVARKSSSGVRLHSEKSRPKKHKNSKMKWHLHCLGLTGCVLLF